MRRGEEERRKKGVEEGRNRRGKGEDGRVGYREGKVKEEED